MILYFQTIDHIFSFGLIEDDPEYGFVTIKDAYIINVYAAKTKIKNENLLRFINPFDFWVSFTHSHKINHVNYVIMNNIK